MEGNSLKQQLRAITIPVFIEMALVMLLGVVDTAMLSRYSDNSVAAVGLDIPLAWAWWACGLASPWTRTSVGSSCFAAGGQAGGAARGL